MQFTEAIRIALQSLWANKLRSTLTLLGVVIGISAVIAVVTFVNGINAYVAERIFNLGADVFIINKRPNVITNVDQFLEAQKRKNITFEDYEAVAEGCRACKVVGASAGGGGIGSGEIRYGERSSTGTAVRGWTPSMARIYDLELVAGRTIQPADMDHRTPVVVIGYDIYENLLESTDPIGKEIRVDGRPYTIIGLGKKEGTTLGNSRDNWVMMPITTWLRQYGSNTSIRIWGKGYGVGTELRNAIDDARVILRARRHDLPGAPDSFEADTNQTFLSIWANLSTTFFMVVVALSSISLVVGGIVIMNIMLVSVTERTREIGIRKALGAKKRDVLAQFLVESSTIAAVGGVIGILMGVAIAKGVTAIIGMPSQVQLWSVMAALTVATSVGLFFGVYPARKAADLQPITALRFEN
jgi:putative ABC transport system permease protein